MPSKLQACGSGSGRETLKAFPPHQHTCFNLPIQYDFRRIRVKFALIPLYGLTKRKKTLPLLGTTGMSILFVVVEAETRTQLVPKPEGAELVCASSTQAGLVAGQDIWSLFPPTTDHTMGVPFVGALPPGVILNVPSVASVLVLQAKPAPGAGVTLLNAPA